MFYNVHMGEERKTMEQDITIECEAIMRNLSEEVKAKNPESAIWFWELWLEIQGKKDIIKA